MDIRMQNQRYYGLDALRGIMMMLGVVLHASFFYLIEAGIRKETPSFFLMIITGFIHQFRMPLFFILAGFFTAMLVMKYGIKAAYINRAKRILLPFLVSLVTILPVTLWAVLSVIVTGMNGGITFITSLADMQPILDEMDKYNMPAHLSPLHLWFLYYLMIFYLFIPVCERFLVIAEQRGWQVKIQRLLSSPWTILLFGTVTAVTLLPFKGASVMVNDRLFIPTPSILVYYLVFFLLGYLFFHYREILETFTRNTGTYCVIALLMFVWAFVPGYMEMQGSESNAVHIIAVVFNGLSTWLFIYYFIGLFLNYFNTDTPAIRMLAQSSYWIYLVHMPVVFFIGLLMTNLELGYPIKFTLLTIVTSLFCYISYQLFVRRSWISLLLNGKRFDTDGTVLASPTLAKI